MGKYTDYIMKTAQDLLSVPSPSGFTHMAADFVKKWKKRRMGAGALGSVVK